MTTSLNLTGTNSNDTLSRNSGNDFITGNDGDDTLRDFMVMMKSVGVMVMTRSMVEMAMTPLRMLVMTQLRWCW